MIRAFSQVKFIKNRPLDFFDIAPIYIFLYCYFLLIPFLLSDASYTLIAFLISFVGFVCFFWGYKTKEKVRIFCRSEYALLNSRILFYASVFLLVLDFLFGFLNVASSRNYQDYTASFKVEDYLTLYWQIVYIIIYSIKYYLYSILMCRGKLVFFLVFLSQILLSFNSPVRLMALSPFIVFTIYGYYMGYIKINLFRVACILMFAPVLFVVLLLVRGAKGSSYIDALSAVINDLSFQKFSALLKVSFESFTSFDYFVSIVMDEFVRMESGVLRIVFMPISRSYWEDKPEAISRIISHQYNYGQYENGGGSVATLYGDAFINGHILGVVCLTFLLGYISKVVYNTVHNNSLSFNQNSPLYMFYSLYVL